MTLDLKHDQAAIAAYKAYHQTVWPEVQNSLKQVGVKDLRIWLWGVRLFMLIEVDDDFDVDQDLSRYLTLDPRCQEWENLMGTLQKPLEGAAPGEKWVEMEQVFELDKN